MKSFKTLKLLSTFLLMLFLWSGKNFQASAQSNISLSISPPISYLQVPPGSTRTHTVVLENTSDQDITVIPSLVDFYSDGKTGRAIISEKLSFPFITFGTSDIKELLIPANKKAQLTLYIDVPKDAEEKEYPISILFFSKEDSSFPTLNASQNAKSKSQISGAIGSNLIILISHQSKLSQALNVISLKTPRFVDSFGEIKFLPLVKNETLASVAASGSAQILNWKKEVVSEFDIYPDVILGSSSRELRALRIGVDIDKPETGNFSYKPNILFGPYQIVINLENDGSPQNLKYIEVVYAFPFSIIVVIIIGMTIAATYYRKIKISR